MTKVNDYNGNEIDFEAASNLMDAEICEAMQAEYESKWNNNQEFIERYAELHAEKYDGEQFAPYFGLAW